MTANELKKYSKKPVNKLRDLATKEFNLFIRNRDIKAGYGCISCGGQITEAGHYFSAGHYAALRFDELNVNGQDTRCNRFLHGNLIHYREGLVKRYGADKVAALEQKAAIAQRTTYKWDRATLIDIILRYKALNSTFQM